MVDSLPVVEGVTHRWVEANGVRLHVAEAGSGPPLLLLHGWPQHWYMWRHQIGPLAQRFRVICPDLRGFGWSEAPDTDYLKETLASDVLALLDALQLPRVQLMGHDWGGWIGFLLCLRAPERFERFLALNIAHPFAKTDARVLDMWRFWYQAALSTPGLGMWMMRDRSGFVRKAIRSSMRHTRPTIEACAVYATRFDDPARARASVLLYRSFLTRELPAISAGRYLRQRLTVPTVLLFGEGDTAITKRMIAGLEDHADDARIEFVPDCGHFIAEDRPDVVTARALAFFRA